jgi:hypothetical protein
MLGTNLTFRTYIGYFELFGERVPLREIKKRLRAFKLSNIVGELARINTLLTISFHDDKKLQKVQSLLVANLIDDEILDAIKRKFGSEKMEQRPVFFPQQILTLLRMSLLVCTENASLIADGKTEAGYTLGRCCLMITDHLLSKKQERAIAEGTNAKQRKHLGLQTAPTRELYNPTELQRAVVRSEIMFADLLESHRDEIKRELQGFDLLDEFRKAAGLSLSRYCDLVFVTFAYYASKEPQEFVEDQTACAINPASLLASGTVTGRELDGFLTLDSIRLQDLQAAIQTTKQALPSLDFTVFRRQPMIEFPGGNLMCVNPSFMLEKLSTGLKWTIVNSFGGNRKKSGKALDAFGLLFELYVDRLMQQIYPSKMGLFTSFPQFANGNEAFDGTLCLGDHLIVFEYKGGGLLLKAKYSGKSMACDDPDVIYSFNTFPWKKYFPSFGTQEDEEVRVRSEAVLRRVRKTIFGSSGAQATP